MVCSASLLLLAFAFQPDPGALRRLFEDNLARRQKEFGAADFRTAQAARDLALFLKDLHDPGASEALAQAVRLDEKIFGPTDAQTLADAAELAAMSAPPAAEPLWQRVAKSSEPALAARGFIALAELRAAAQDREGAAALYRQALSKEEEAGGKESPRVAVVLNALGVTVPDGIPLLERALTINRKGLGERHPETATTLANLAGLYLNANRPDLAIRAADTALGIYTETLGPGHPRVATVSMILGFCWRAKSDRVRAERFFRRALAIDEKALGPNAPETLNDRRNLAELLRQ
jgi:tetratricopeptide (TPR) repeat protein